MHVPTLANSIIVDAVKANKFLAIDDHKSAASTTQLAAIGIHIRGEKETVVALFTKEHSDYYTINEVSMDHNGIPHLTRNACAGTIFNATDDVREDVKFNYESYDWDLIAARPALDPGKIVEVITPSEHDDHIGSPMYFEHALMGIQLRINSAKHMEAGIATLKSSTFNDMMSDLVDRKAEYLNNPTRANAVLVKQACDFGRAIL